MRTPTTVIHSYADADVYLRAGRNHNDRPAPSGNRTRIVRDFLAPGTISVIYHQTPIVTYVEGKPDRIRLDCGGWFTKTTLERFAEYTPRAWGIGMRTIGGGHPSNRGEYVAVVDRIVRDHPDAPKVQTCRTCKGTTRSKWSSDYACHRCAGTGSVDYGSKVTPIEWRSGTGWIHDHGVFTNNEGATSPKYSCSCAMCQGGFESWQEMYA
jgi:hypothetical protein